MAFAKPKSRTSDTEKEYVKRSRTMLKRFTLETGVEIRNNTECSTELEKHLKRVVFKEKYSKSTIRKQKASLHYYFKENEFNVLKDMIEKIILTAPEKKQEKRTSAKKYKCLPESEYLKLTAKINRTNGKYDQMILAWIEATRIVGIRPKEWIQTKLIQKEHEGKVYKILKVMNAKNTNGRTFGKFRHIILQDLSDQEFFNITTMITFVESIQIEKGGLKEARKAWDKFYHSCRRRLSYLDQKSRPNAKKSITLYSARHQFAADLKANEIDDYEKAALMGHGSIITIDSSYGKKHQGKKGRFRVRPHRDDVISVIKMNSHNIEKKMKKEQFIKSTNNVNPVIKNER